MVEVDDEPPEVDAVDEVSSEVVVDASVVAGVEVSVERSAERNCKQCHREHWECLTWLRGLLFVESVSR